MTPAAALSIDDLSAPLRDAPVRLVLAGGGHAHLAVLEAWIRRPPARVETWLVTPDVHTVYSGMVPGWMAGHYAETDALIALPALARRAGVRLVVDSICALDADRQRVMLDSGGTLPFDLLSLAIGGEVDTSSLALLEDRLLPVRPMGDLIRHWPDVLAKAQRKDGFRLIVAGGGAGGVELALAADQALKRIAPSARVMIMADGAGLTPGHAAAVRRRIAEELSARGIAVLHGHAVGAPQGILLDDGSLIEADCVIAATGSKPPPWLKRSGLQVDARGFVAVGADLRSLSHPSIFAAGDIATRMDRPVARSGVHAVKSGPILAANLRRWQTRWAQRQPARRPHCASRSTSRAGAPCICWPRAMPARSCHGARWPFRGGWRGG